MSSYFFVVYRASESVDKVTDLFNHLRDNPTILRILAGLGHEDPLQPDQKLRHHTLFPPTVTSAVKFTKEEVFPPELIDNPNLSIDPDEFANSRVAEALTGISILRWSDHSETQCVKHGSRFVFAPRYFAAENTLQLLEAILFFVLRFPEGRAIDRFVSNTDSVYKKALDDLEGGSARYESSKTGTWLTRYSESSLARRQTSSATPSSGSSNSF
jgi:hypothetical protein